MAKCFFLCSRPEPLFRERAGPSVSFFLPLSLAPEQAKLQLRVEPRLWKSYTTTIHTQNKPGTWAAI